MPYAPVNILEWTPEYAVHVAEIDHGRQTWFDVINRLHDAMLAGKVKEVLGTLLAETIRYTCDHVAHEKALMTNVRYGLPQRLSSVTRRRSCDSPSRTQVLKSNPREWKPTPDLVSSVSGSACASQE